MSAATTWIVMLAVSVAALLAVAWASDRLIKAQRDLIEHQSTTLESSLRILAHGTVADVFQTLAEDETFIPDMLAMFRRIASLPDTAESAPIDCDHCGSTEDVHEHHTNPACGIDGQPCTCGDTEAFCPNCCVCEHP